MKEHFCSDRCEITGEPCDLCMAQRRKKADDKALAEGKPTLKYNPFATLLKGSGT